MKLNIAFLFLSIFFLLTFSLIFIFVKNLDNNPSAILTQTPSPTPTPTLIILKEALPKDAYTIIMVGDSMTAALGENSDQLRKYLKEYYPEKTFGIYNLAKGSTNITTLQNLLESEILNREFEVILIESFGYNPLSDLPLEEGLKKQTEALDKAVKIIREKKQTSEVNPIIVFVATIAPNRDRYGGSTVDLSNEKRGEWADERSAYIENHIKYAKDNDIPLINIYEKSKNAEGTGNLEYIEQAGFIHPSEKGIEFISREIADFLYNSQILPP